MNELATLRRRVGDRTKAQRDIATGNGADRSFHLQYQNVFNVTVLVAAVAADPTTYTVDSPGGRVIFNVAPAEGAEVAFDYNYAAYTDAELQEILDDEGLAGATVAVLDELIADSARLYDYTQGETTNKRSQVFDHLLKLQERYTKAWETSKRGSGIRFGKRAAGRDLKINRRPNFGGTQDLTRYP